MATMAGNCRECGQHFKHVRAHERLTHGIKVRGPGANAAAAGPILKGEAITLGPVPTEPTVVRIMNSHASRDLVVYVLPMTDVTDLVAAALRTELKKKGLTT